jgi:hypothetical protein
MPRAEREELNRQLKDAVGVGLVRRSRSGLVSPVLFVREAGGSPRLCIDYISLNEVTRKNACPVPRVYDTPDELKNAVF